MTDECFTWNTPVLTTPADVEAHDSHGRPSAAEASRLPQDHPATEPPNHRVTVVQRARTSVRHPRITDQARAPTYLSPRSFARSSCHDNDSGMHLAH